MSAARAAWKLVRIRKTRFAAALLIVLLIGATAQAEWVWWAQAFDYGWQGKREQFVASLYIKMDPGYQVFTPVEGYQRRAIPYHSSSPSGQPFYYQHWYYGEWLMNGGSNSPHGYTYRCIIERWDPNAASGAGAWVHHHTNDFTSPPED